MLRRRRPPNQGLWNGVGGRIEAGETPLIACLREVREETGFVIDKARFAGIVSWTGFEARDGAFVVFSAEAPEGEPASCDEGELAWKPRAWVLASPEVVSNIHCYGPEVLAGQQPRWHRFVYRDGAIVGYQVLPCPSVADKERRRR